jgi:hypothetical protein
MAGYFPDFVGGPEPAAVERTHLDRRAPTPPDCAISVTSQLLPVIEAQLVADKNRTIPAPERTQAHILIA